MNITFTNTLGVSEIYAPKPADKFIPEWYKDLESYSGEVKKPTGQGNTTATIKRCMPVFDAITNGYIISTYTDLYVSQKEQLDSNENLVVAPWYEWPSYEPLQFHSVVQAPNYPNRNGHQFSYPKWINSWGIKTPAGYSTLFTQPFHRESVFTILPGVVDTDTYTAPINFPFVLNNIDYEGLIPAGTPMAQVIPFKRDSWEMSFGVEKDVIEQKNLTTKLRSKFFDSYKTQFRQTKEYK